MSLEFITLICNISQNHSDRKDHFSIGFPFNFTFSFKTIADINLEQLQICTELIAAQFLDRIEYCLLQRFEGNPFELYRTYNTCRCAKSSVEPCSKNNFKLEILTIFSPDYF